MNDVQKFILSRAMQKVANQGYTVATEHSNPYDLANSASNKIGGVFDMLEADSKRRERLAFSRGATGLVLGGAGGAGLGLGVNALFGNTSTKSKIISSLLGGITGTALGGLTGFYSGLLDRG